jgi:hypothetical protein
VCVRISVCVCVCVSLKGVKLHKSRFRHLTSLLVLALILDDCGLT